MSWVLNPLLSTTNRSPRTSFSLYFLVGCRYRVSLEPWGLSSDYHTTKEQVDTSPLSWWSPQTHVYIFSLWILKYLRCYYTVNVSLSGNPFIFRGGNHKWQKRKLTYTHTRTCVCGYTCTLTRARTRIHLDAYEVKEVRINYRNFKIYFYIDS